MFASSFIALTLAASPAVILTLPKESGSAEGLYRAILHHRAAGWVRVSGSLHRVAGRDGRHRVKFRGYIFMGSMIH